MAAIVVNQLTASLGVQVKPRLLFEYPIFLSFCAQLHGMVKRDRPFQPLEATASRDVIVAEGLIGMIGMMHRRAIKIPDDNAYNIVSKVDFSTGVLPEQLQRARQKVLHENPIFR